MIGARTDGRRRDPDAHAQLVGAIGHQGIGRAEVPFVIWPPLVNWIRTSRWTSTYSVRRGVPNGHSFQSYQATWLEMCIFFKLATGFRFPVDYAIADAAALFRAAFRRACSTMSIMVHERKVNFCAAFPSKEGVSSLVPLTGLRLAGVLRRPIVSHEDLLIAAEIVRGIFAATPTRTTFGRLTTWHPGKAALSVHLSTVVSTDTPARATSMVVCLIGRRCHHLRHGLGCQKVPRFAVPATNVQW